MKLSGLRRDVQAIEQGEWVDNIPEMGDLRLKVRGVGNADWRRIEAKLIGAVPRNKRIDGRLDPEEADRITGACLQAACLLDWGGFEDDDGSAVPYSKDQASELLTNPETRAFRDAVLWAANMVGQKVAAAKEDGAKN